MRDENNFSGCIVPLLQVGLALVQAVAFFEGAHVYGWPWWVAIPLFGLALILGPLGAIGLMIVAYAGATRGWGWDWWQAVLLVAPYLVITVLVMLFAGSASLLDTVRRR